MDTPNDPIKALIETTGLSCDDLLEKLLQYKRQQSKTVDQSKEIASSASCSGNGVEKPVECTAAVTETSCSSHPGSGNDKQDECLPVVPENNCLVGHFENPESASNKVDNVECIPVVSETSSSHPGSEKDKQNECSPAVPEKNCDAEHFNELQSVSNEVEKSYEPKLPNSSNANTSIDENHDHDSLQVLGESDSFSGNEEAATENNTSTIEQENDRPKNTPNETQENTSKTSSADIIETTKEYEENTQKIRDDSHSEQLQEVSDEKRSQSLNISSIEKNSELECNENVSAESEKNITNGTERNELNSLNVGETEISSTLQNVSNFALKTNSETNSTTSTDSSSQLLNRRKSISYELVQKLSERLKCDETVNSTSNPKENDIEVCQVEEMEVAPRPMLKLRSDLFADNSKGTFKSSDHEDEDENPQEIKDFLNNIEEITGEFKDNPPSNNSLRSDCNEPVKVSPPRVRKVKLGFVKKRILHKAIKCINEVEAKKTEHVKHNKKLLESEKSNCDKEIPKTKDVTEEEIRENLKLQLSSLRNRKKDNLMKDKCKIDNLITNYDKHTFVKKKASNTITVATDEFKNSTTVDSRNLLENNTEDSYIEEIESEKKECLFSLSSDTNFVIVDVQGGVEFSDLTESIEKPKKDPIKLTKTKDVTKIKGWKNKKFQLHQEENPKEHTKKTNKHSKEDFESDTSLPSCSKVKDTEETGKIVEQLSPFVSNSLEEFLTENSTLNISYNIPKLGAVQGITNQKYDTVLIPQTSEYTNSESEKKEESDKPKNIKPKTLAEKRRMLENSKLKELLLEEKVFNKESYILYNGRKLHVPTMTSEKCLANIKYAPKSNIQHDRVSQTVKNKKLSLLDLYHQYNSCVSYKPGPLREKRKLQNKDSVIHWDTKVKKLPSIKLNVISEVGKPIPPHLVHHFNFEPNIKEDRLEFALSALYCPAKKEKKKQGFSLSVPYANKQKYILVRKKKEIFNEIVYDIAPEKNTIESILDDIISYVENKENEDSIIKDAEIYKEEEKRENEVRSSTEVSAVKKPNKNTRLKTEISRLSCKVLSVSFDEKDDNRMCQKSFCKFGCVCKSLTCAPQLPMHCSKIECMFECKCSLSENISLGKETGSLTRDTVTRLEDQAKKNLAKVEKEFTQTIIHANDQTILIPSSDRSKTKRVKRMPKRYSDFMEDFDDKVPTPLIDNEEDISKKLPDCFVELHKLKIKEIVPLCLYHNLYNCNCLNQPDKKSNALSENESHEIMQNKVDKKIKCSNVTDKPKKKSNLVSEDENLDELRDRINRKRKNSSDEKKKITPKKVKSLRESSSLDNNSSDSDITEEINERYQGRFCSKIKAACARHIEVHPTIKARNEIPYYKTKLQAKIQQANQSTVIETANLDESYYEPLTEFIDIMTPMTILASDRLKLFIVRSRKHKRKQTFNDVDTKGTVKKLKVNEEPIESNEVFDNGSRIGNLPYTPVFDGEIIFPTDQNKDFVKQLGMKSAARYMRLLPWNDLLRNYYNRKINIWCNDSYNKLLMNSSDVDPPEGYVAITKSTRKNGIMNWILSKKLPNKTPAELVHLILSPKSGNFEISGICLKNISEGEKANRVIETKTEKKVSESPMSSEKSPRLVDSTMLEHKNHKNETKILIMTQKQYNKQYLFDYSRSDQVNDEKFQPLHVRLPVFESLRWRLLFLNSNFTFLSFENSNYSIKYTDLKNILKKAQSTNKTICLQGKALSKGYSRKNFGIYAVPNFLDMLFIGPYGLNEEHGLKTLRYLRQELVSTTFFEMVQGGVIPNKKQDRWLVNKNVLEDEKKFAKCSKKSTGNMLKLSYENLNQEDQNPEYAVLTPLPNSSEKTPEKSKNSDSEMKSDAQELHDFHSHLYDSSGNLTTSVDLEDKALIKFPDFTILNGKIMRPQDFNGYLYTNIPDFGYLGVIKDNDTNEIEVSWPFGNKVLRFANLPYARQFIKRRFANLLLPVPVTFNLQIFMKTDVENLQFWTPVDPKFLNGTHICGAFGIMDSRTLTPALAKTLGTTQEDVLQRLAKRAQFLGALEIDKLKEQEKVLIKTKKELILKKQMNLKRYMDLLMILPEEERLERYAKFRQEFDGCESTNSDSKVKTESPKQSEKILDFIEIDDSDSEEEKRKNTKKSVKSSEHTPEKQIMPTQSILKSHISPRSSQSTSSENESSRPVENFKLVKTSTGKLVLMKDKSGASLSRTLTGMKMKISNNRVIEDKS